MAIETSELLVIGKFTTVYGVRGWLKVYSFTEPMENLLDYPECYVAINGQWQPIELSEGKRHGKGLVAHIKGVDDREEARVYGQCEIAVPRTALPELAANEFYWHQLEGLQVQLVSDEGETLELGRVKAMMETGANDVLVVQGNKDSIDKRERLIPYLPGQVVLEVDTKAGVIQVDWDPDF